MMVSNVYGFYANLIGLLLPVVAAHSWVERLMRIHPNGTMVGKPGYIRATVSRLDPSFNDLQMQHLLPPNDGVARSLTEQDRMCKESQTFGSYSPELPPLEARAGDFIALQYQENGHVTLPQNTPQKSSSGTVYIYSTSNPTDDDTLLSIHKIWNKQGTGGDGRGRLLATRPFDDGQCYQMNSGPLSMQRQREFMKVPMDPQGGDLWCQNDIRLPLDVRDSLTLYWVWDWPSSNPEMDEIYTSCMDIKIVPGTQDDGENFIDGQDLNTAAVKGQMQSGA
ncbi:hypothetical protein MRS44_003821 [Fusarium solani]|uniref:uncharacterized protein n=1 Tax=Fusarium solani TaxID=169388 RepID=UPI0032C47A77|nr:hypothetical protein MRS44_003821 [Fusarium solani]